MFVNVYYLSYCLYYICTSNEAKRKNIGIMKNYIFTDILTNETISIECNPFEIHNIEITNVEISRWCEGRIIERIES